MSAELVIYKKNRITSLQNAFNSNIAKLTNDLNSNIKKIQRQNISIKIKQTQINSLISQYNSLINFLKQNLAQNILLVNNFTPKPIIINKNKNALMIGINYLGTYSQLYGCINDVNNLKIRLSDKGFSNMNIITDLTSKKPTKANILEEFKNLLINAKEGDFLFFSYSGHGIYAKDMNGDEITGYDQCIVPSDFKIIVDDELKSLIQTNLKANVTLFALFDSCYSGTVLDLRYQYMDSLNYDNFTENQKQFETLGNVFMISGCNDYQTSADAFINNSSQGAMTWSLLESLKQKPNCTWRELVKNMRLLLKNSKFVQIPQFSCGKFENIDEKVFI